MSQQPTAMMRATILRIKSLPLAELVRYGVVGIINSAVGYAIFIIALRLLRLSPQVSNALGYCIGLTLTFALYRYFVFNGARFSIQSAIRFATCFVVAFSVNQGILLLLIRTSLATPELAQVAAMAVYTLVFYLMNKYIVWVPPKAGA